MASIEGRLHAVDHRACSTSQQVRVIMGAASSRARTRSSSRPTAGSRSSTADFVVVATGLAAAGARLRRRRPRAGAHHARRVPAARDPRAHDRDRLGRHRRRVHAPLRLARLEGHAARVAPAGAADQGRRGRRGARGGVPRARRHAAQGRARELRSSATATPCASRCDDGRVDRGLARGARRRLDPQHRGARARRRRRRASTTAATCR